MNPPDPPPNDTIMLGPTSSVNSGSALSQPPPPQPSAMMENGDKITVPPSVVSEGNVSKSNGGPVVPPSYTGVSPPSCNAATDPLTAELGDGALRPSSASPVEVSASAETTALPFMPASSLPGIAPPTLPAVPVSNGNNRAPPSPHNSLPPLPPPGPPILDSTMEEGEPVIRPPPVFHPLTIPGASQPLPVSNNGPPFPQIATGAAVAEPPSLLPPHAGAPEGQHVVSSGSSAVTLPPLVKHPEGGVMNPSSAVCPSPPLPVPSRPLPPEQAPVAAKVQQQSGVTIQGDFPLRPSQPLPNPTPPGTMYHPNLQNMPPQRPSPPPNHNNNTAAAPPPPPLPPPIMRELRVEDALLYLDDVKREFGDRPRIYNEFLEIMKNFKSQEVDTPGVIERVSKLFRGYNNLILGFNKFLPDGYKIGLEDIEKAENEHRRQEAVAAAAAALKVQPQSGVTIQGDFPPRSSQTVPNPNPPGTVYHQNLQNMPPQMGAPPVRPGGPGQQQPPPPPFHPNHPHPPQGMAGGAINKPGGRPASPPHSFGAPVGAHGPGGARPPPGGVPPPHASRPGPPQPSAGQPPPQAAPQQHQAVEFDHAISYVTNIKKRFANDPGTYHNFLEILHTYQKEQRGIKEVLEQVAELFADHPDLLKEFTFFLPDAVQEQAKERLHRAAEASERRQAVAMDRGGQTVPFDGRRMPPHNEFRGMSPQKNMVVLPSHGIQPGSQKFIDMTRANQSINPPEGPRDNVSPASSRHPGLSPPGRKRPFSPPRDVGAPMLPLHPPQPETFVYNSAVERQFFDAAKEALTSYTRDGGQAWAEFLKCLHLYSQEILSRSEMLNFVEPLLGKRHSELFEEFKRILVAAGAQNGPTPSMEDSWYSVPLSEIDFSRCRRCSPSYRALPRDYPAPPCSERNDEEGKVLNDIWVSLPVGSEESYTFRHMRRNQHEEVLFRCEDERFEIDMVIDSNACTLRRLEPVAEEIAQLAEEEQGAPTGTGMGGKRFQYVFDKSILLVTHRNSITRIYGDAGQEMLDLMVKNPTVAIPVVVQRLRQKGLEWVAARENLNRHWKELAEVNYYKSLDNRSLTWRTTDKRATSTRTLVAEIKDRAANSGNEGAVALAARLEKAKEEHGSFYEVTMKDLLSPKLDLTNLPKPDKKLFSPHLSLMYENSSNMQRDAYRIISFALERGATSPSDKERCHRLWRDFLGPLFGLSLSWMQRPALDFHESSSADTPTVVSNGEDPIDSDNEEGSFVDENEIGNNVVTEQLPDRSADVKESETQSDHHPLPPGTCVSTVFGKGIVKEFRRADDTYVVNLRSTGTAFLQPNAVLCSVLQVETSGFTDQLRSTDRQTLERPNDILAIGTQSLYLFFRLHQILIRRLNIAKEMAYNMCTDRSLSTLVEQMRGSDNDDLGRKRYEAYISLVYALIEGGYNLSGGAAEGGKYEDRVRSLLGHGAYELATMDKLISHIVKNLQNMASDDTMHSLIQLFRRHHDAGSFKPEAYRQEAAYLSEGDNMFAFQYCKVPDDDEAVVHMEFLGVISDSDDGEAGSGDLASDHKDSDIIMSEESDMKVASVPAAKRQRRG